MHEERAKILDMLSEGKITAEESEGLLKALKEKRSGRWPVLDWIASLFGAQAEYTEEQDWTLDGAGVSLITAQTENGSISLCGSDQDQVTVRAWKKVRAPSEEAAKEFAAQVQVHVERQGSEIQIYKEHPKPPIGIAVSVSYEMSCPRKVDLSLHTSNGAIHIHQVDGTVEAVTANGAIELHGGAGQVKLRTTNGAVRVQDAMGHVQADTSNGKILVSTDRLEEGIFATSNGAIDVKVREGNGPVAARTSNGAIHVALPTGFSGQLDARTTHGHVHAGLPISSTEEGRNRLVGQIGDGGETTITLRTVNGSIHVRGQQ